MPEIANQQPVSVISAKPRPADLRDLFWSFTWLALQGFGGVLAVVQQELVEKKKWLTPEEFLEDWAVAQVMPGPNVINLGLMMGDRYFGLQGAMLVLLGLLTVPLLAVGGAITAAPDMHRHLVVDKLWLTDGQFTSSIALAQAAPGPNVMFVALMGWNVGLNAGGYGYAVLGASAALIGILLPSTTFTLMAARWGHRNRELRAVRAFKQGMAPIVVALLIATGWILVSSHGPVLQHWHLWLVAGITAVLVWRTRIHLLWLLGAGGVLGAVGWV